MIQHIPPRGHHLSKMSAAIIPQTHTIKTVGSLWPAGWMLQWSFAHFSSDPVPTISLFFSIVKRGYQKTTKASLPAPSCLVWPMRNTGRKLENGREREASIHLCPTLYIGLSSSANTTPTGLPLEPDSNRQLRLLGSGNASVPPVLVGVMAFLGLPCLSWLLLQLF